MASTTTLTAIDRQYTEGLRVVDPTKDGYVTKMEQILIQKADGRYFTSVMDDTGDLEQAWFYAYFLNKTIIGNLPAPKSLKIRALICSIDIEGHQWAGNRPLELVCGDYHLGINSTTSIKSYYWRTYNKDSLPSEVIEFPEYVLGENGNRTWGDDLINFGFAVSCSSPDGSKSRIHIYASELILTYETYKLTISVTGPGYVVPPRNSPLFEGRGTYEIGSDWAASGNNISIDRAFSYAKRTKIFKNGVLDVDDSSSSEYYTYKLGAMTEDVDLQISIGPAAERIASDVYQKVNGTWQKVTNPRSIILPDEKYRKE